MIRVSRLFARKPITIAAVVDALYLVVAVVLLAAQPSRAATPGYPAADQTERLRAVQSLLLNDRFNEADSVSLAMRQRYQRDPSGYFCAAQVLWGKMRDREENIRPERFEYTLDTVVSLATRILDTCDLKTAAWMHLWRGLARSLHEQWAAKFGQAGGNITIGLAGEDEFRRGLEADNYVADLYYGMGLHDFWVSSEAGMLSRAGIVEDTRSRGLMELHHAAKHARVFADAARLALAEAWIEMGHLDSGLTMVRSLRTEFPEGDRLRWLQAKAYEAKGDAVRAAEVYAELRSRLLRNPGNYRQLIRCDYLLCQAYERAHLPGKSVEQAKLAQSYMDQAPPETRRRLSDEIAHLRRIARRR